MHFKGVTRGCVVTAHAFITAVRRFGLDIDLPRVLTLLLMVYINRKIMIITTNNGEFYYVKLINLPNKVLTIGQCHPERTCFSIVLP